MFRLLIVGAIVLAPLASAATPCTMGAPDDPDRPMQAHPGLHLMPGMSHVSTDPVPGASLDSADPATTDDDRGHAVSGACADECATHFQVPSVGVARPVSVSTARASLASAAAPSAPAAAIEHVPLG